MVSFSPKCRCEILPNQPFRGKLSANQTRSMIDIACLPPAINQADIYRNGLSNMGISPASDALNEFGISLGNQMAVVPGRILDSPKIAYLGKVLETRDSAWNLRDQKFVKAVPLKNCLALAINERPGDFQGAGDPDFENVRHPVLSNRINPAISNLCPPPFLCRPSRISQKCARFVE